MKLLIPTTVDDTIFVSSNVYETAPAAYNAGTTYASGAFVSVTTGTVVLIYESLQASNTGHTPASSPTWWVYRQTTYTEYNVGTTYALGETVIVAATHKVYESLSAGNVGNAVTDTTKWLDTGFTEPWLSFDAKVGSQTERTGSIYFELEAGVVENIAIFNLSGSTLNIKQTDPTEGVVYNETFDLISTDNVFDGYSYCFAPFLVTRHTVIPDIPPYGSSTIEITITGGSNTETVKCGEIVLGRVRDIGATLYSPSFEIQDFSRKDQDDFGNFSITVRPFSNRIPMDVRVENSRLNFMKQTLEDYRSTAVVCITTEKEYLSEAFLVYGYYRTARTVASYPNDSILSIEWEGLI